MKKSGRALLASAPRDPSRRPRQLASLIRSELGGLMFKEFELPKGVLATVTNIEVAADLSVAHVGVSVLPFARGEEAMRLIGRAKHAVQQQLNERLKLYRVPKLEFKLDPAPERAAKIEHLLDHLGEPRANP